MNSSSLAYAYRESLPGPEMEPNFDVPALELIYDADVVIESSELNIAECTVSVTPLEQTVDTERQLMPQTELDKQQLFDVKTIQHKYTQGRNTKYRRIDAPRALDKYIKKQDIVSPALIPFLLKTKNSVLINWNISKFTGVDHNLLVNKLIMSGDPKTAANILSHMKGIDMAVAAELIRAGFAKRVVDNLTSFNNPNNGLVIRMSEENAQVSMTDIKHISELGETQASDNLIMVSQPDEIPDDIRTFDDLNHDALAQRLVSLGRTAMVAQHKEKFNLHNLVTLVDLIFETGQGALVAENFEKFNDVNHDDVANALLERGYAFPLIRNLHKFRNLDPSIAYSLIEQKGGDRVMQLAPVFPDIDMNKVVGRLIETGQVTMLTRYQDTFIGVNIDSTPIVAGLERGLLTMQDACKILLKFECTNLPLALDTNIKVFREYATAQSYLDCQALMDGTITEEFQNFGVTKIGIAGLEQLQAIIENLQERFIDPDAKIQKVIMQNDLARSLFKSFIRYSVSQYDPQYDERRLTKVLSRTSQEPAYTKLLDGYTKSANMKIMTRTGLKQAERPSISEDARVRYGRLYDVLMTAIGEIADTSPGRAPFDDQRRDIVGVLTSKMDRMTQARNKMTAEGRASHATHLNSEIQQLREFIKKGFDSFDDLERTFGVIAKDSRLSDSIMVALTARALRFSPDQNVHERRQRYHEYEKRIRQLNKDPTIEDLSYVAELFGHAIMQETYLSEFKEDRTKDMIKQLFSVNALQIAIEQSDASSVPDGGRTTIQFVPSRSVLMEFSGSTGDICWAGKYENIAAQFENMTAVTIIRRPNMQQPKAVGSFMLIETTNFVTGDPVLVVRGLNPIQNFINQVHVGEFFDAVNSYVQKIGKIRGREVGYVIDNISGGSGTNRPLLFGFLRAKRLGMKKIHIEANGTTFNQWNITNDVYGFK